MYTDGANEDSLATNVLCAHVHGGNTATLYSCVEFELFERAGGLEGGRDSRAGLSFRVLGE